MHKEPFFSWGGKSFIYRPNGAMGWSKSHAQSPRALDLGNGSTRIVFSTRDAQNRSRPGYIDVVTSNPRVIQSIGREPLLELGSAGEFDDCGVMPSCFLKTNDRTYMFYTGWNISQTVPYRLSIGLAESTNGGCSFQKVSQGPVMDRSLHETLGCSQPFVIPWNGGFRMYYLSIFKWEEIDGRLESHYNIRFADSDDIFHWLPKGDVAIDCDTNFTRAIAVPTVWREDGSYRMIYCYRGSRGFRTDPASAYRLGYAVSDDGNSWTRRDSELGLERSESGWDSEMQAYADYYTKDVHAYLFYSGNGFGKAGIGFARRLCGRSE